MRPAERSGQARPACAFRRPPGLAGPGWFPRRRERMPLAMAKRPARRRRTSFETTDRTSGSPPPARIPGQPAARGREPQLGPAGLVTDSVPQLQAMSRRSPGAIAAPHRGSSSRSLIAVPGRPRTEALVVTFGGARSPYVDAKASRTGAEQLRLLTQTAVWIGCRDCDLANLAGHLFPKESGWNTLEGIPNSAPNSPNLATNLYSISNGPLQIRLPL